MRAAWLVVVALGCGTSPSGSAAPAPVTLDAGRTPVDARPVVLDASVDAAPPPALRPRPPTEQLRGEAIVQGAEWVRRTYGAPTAAAAAACEAECGELSRAANEHAERDQR